MDGVWLRPYQGNALPSFLEYLLNALALYLITQLTRIVLAYCRDALDCIAFSARDVVKNARCSSCTRVSNVSYFFFLLFSLSTTIHFVFPFTLT